MLAKRYIVRGRVQGVGFRWFVDHEARELGLNGWVRNNFDGSVEVLAVGTNSSWPHCARSWKKDRAPPGWTKWRKRRPSRLQVSTLSALKEHGKRCNPGAQ